MTSFMPTAMTDPRNNAAATRIFFRGSPLDSRQGTIDFGRYTQSPEDIQEPRKWTQVDQDHADEEAHQHAMDSLIQSWNDRLSLISVITTFFAATEAQLLGNAKPQSITGVSPILQAANAGLMGALVVHVFAAVTSFLAAFFLIRYKLREATNQERKIEGLSSTTSTSTSDVFSKNPHIVRVGPFSDRHPPTNLLRRCHYLCMWLAAVGFVLALMGIVCFAWAAMPTSVSIFSSVCAGVCFVAALTAVL